LIGPKAEDIENLLYTTVSVGNFTDIQKNPICLGDGKITDGGWYPCSG
jgi:hypothetical protein